MATPWPKEIREILVKYHIAQRKKKNGFNPKEKENLVFDLIQTYKKLSSDDQSNFLVPAKGEYLENDAIWVSLPADSTKIISDNPYDSIAIGLNYKWDKTQKDGFVPGTDVHTQLVKGQEYDRIGSPVGRFLCPIKSDGTPETYYARAIPYYIPNEDDVTSSPAYHRYVVNESYNEDNDNPRIGIIAAVFREKPNDGGGRQLVFRKKTVIELIDEEVLSNE